MMLVQLMFLMLTAPVLVLPVVVLKALVLPELALESVADSTEGRAGDEEALFGDLGIEQVRLE